MPRADPRWRPDDRLGAPCTEQTALELFELAVVAKRLTRVFNQKVAHRGRSDYYST